jgi:uncharacterized membrane protein YbhN (UPF0104 family)
LVVAAIGVGATKLDWPAVVAAVSRTEPFWFAGACGCFMMLPVLMASEWRLIGARPAADAGDLRTLLSLGCFTYFVQTYLNAAVAYGTAMLRLIRGRGWTIGQGIGLVTVDQLAEGISRLVFCGTVLLLAAGSMANSPWMIGTVGGAAMLVVGFAAVRSKGVVRRLVLSRLRGTGLNHPGTTAETVDDVLEIMTGRAFAWGIALATTKKVAKIGAILAIAQALDLHMSPWSAIYFLAILECATTLPLVPGNLGVIESAAVTVFASQGFSAEAGLSIGLLYRAGIHLGTAVMAAGALAANIGSRPAAAMGINAGESDVLPQSELRSKAA